MIAFSTHLSGDLPQLWVMNADGTGLVQLTTEGGSDPSWSPDGTRLVYMRWNSREYAPGNNVLWIIDVRTGEKEQLTHQW